MRHGIVRSATGRNCDGEVVRMYRPSTVDQYWLRQAV